MILALNNNGNVRLASNSTNTGKRYVAKYALLNLRFRGP